MLTNSHGKPHTRQAKHDVKILVINPIPGNKEYTWKGMTHMIPIKLQQKY
jgi:hypothetical protein